MRPLLVALALLIGAVSAGVPLVYDNTNQKDAGHSLSASDYLRTVFGFAQEPDIGGSVFSSRVTSTSTADSVLDVLPDLGLAEAGRIARLVNLKGILEKNKLSSVTLFVPTDEAIMKWMQQVPAAMAEDVATLTKLCRAWIVPFVVRSADFVDEKLLPTLVTDPEVKLRIDIYDNVEKITVNGAPVVLRDFTRDASVIHAVGKMIYPFPDGNIFDTLAKVDQFSMLVSHIRTAGLVDAISTTDPLTLFAPINRAFHQLPASVLLDLMDNPTKLQRLLEYHAVADAYYSKGIADDTVVDTMIDHRIRFNIVDGKLVLDKRPDNPDQAVEVAYADIPATNGVIHVIEKLLTPPS